MIDLAATETVPLAEAAAAIGITPDELLEAAHGGRMWDPQAFLVMGEWRVPSVEVRGPRIEMHRRNLRAHPPTGASHD